MSGRDGQKYLVGRSSERGSRQIKFKDGDGDGEPASPLSHGALARADIPPRSLRPVPIAVGYVTGLSPHDELRPKLFLFAAYIPTSISCALSRLALFLGVTT